MRILTLISLSTAVIATPTLALEKNANRAAFQTNFKQADGNKDKKLTKSEFRKLIDADAADDLGKAPMIKRFDAYDTAFARVDANKDGNVTLKELAAMRGK